MESLGVVEKETIKKLREAKLLLIVGESGEVMVDPTDKSRAIRIIQEAEGPVEPGKVRARTYNLCGIETKIPVDLKTSYFGYVAKTQISPVSKTKIWVNYHCKPAEGLDPDTNLKRLNKVSIEGKEIELGVAAYSPAYEGIVICDDNGYPLIEVTPHNIFVLFDTKGKPDATKKIFSELILFALAVANHHDEGSLAIYKKIWDDQSPQRDELQMIEFEKIVSESVRSELKLLEKKVKDAETNLERYEDEIFKAAKQKSDAILHRDALQTVLNGNMREKAKQEWDRLKGLEKTGAIRNVSVTKEQFSFTTREVLFTPDPCPLFIDHGGGETKIEEAFPLGVFRVTTKTGKNFSLKIENMSRSLSYDGARWAHPHVRDGGVCYGNMTEKIAKFAATRNFEAIAMVCLRWLENVDVKDSWGMMIWRWYEDHKKRVKSPKKKKAKVKK